MKNMSVFYVYNVLLLINAWKKNEMIDLKKDSLFFQLTCKFEFIPFQCICFHLSFIIGLC